MKKISFVMDIHKKNIIFNKKIRPDSDDSYSFYHTLYEEFKKRGYLISTSDINRPEDSDIIIVKDFSNKFKPENYPMDKLFFIALESPVFLHQNFEKSYHQYFNKVFTWYDDFIDNKKYFKVNYSFTFPKLKLDTKKTKLCCLIISNKSSSAKNELYSERKKAIEWFEKYAKKDFDLYGRGWNEYRIKSIKALKIFNKIPYFPKLLNYIFSKNYSVYKGTVKDKVEIMGKYKFSICFENVQDVPGYITEKIFHSFFAATVPIYLGANNISKYIPEDTFIDMRKFINYSDLYEFIKNMTNEEYEKYLNNINNFLESKQGEVFTNKYNVKLIVNEILKDNNETL